MLYNSKGRQRKQLLKEGTDNTDTDTHDSLSECHALPETLRYASW